MTIYGWARASRSGQSSAGRSAVGVVPAGKAIAVLRPKWPWARFGGKFGGWRPGQHGILAFEIKHEGMNVYENEFPTQCPSSGCNGGYEYRWRRPAGYSISSFSGPGLDEKQRPGLLEEQKVPARYA